jgi:hypothetical protein
MVFLPLITNKKSLNEFFGEILPFPKLRNLVNSMILPNGFETN